MSRHITKLGWLIIITIGVLFLTGMNQFIHSGPKQAANQSERKTNIQPIEQIPSKYPEIPLMLDTKKTDTYHLAIQVPTTKSETINNEVYQWINKQKQDFKKKLKEDTSTDTDLPSLQLTLDEQKVTDNYYTLQFTGEGATEHHISKVFNIDIDNDRFITINDVLNMNDDTLQTIQQKAKEALKREENTSITDEQLVETLTINPEQWNWSIDENGLTLYMDVAGESESNNLEKLNIPLDELYLNLNDKIDTIIDMSKEQKQEMEQAIQEEQERIQQAEKEDQTADDHGKYVALTFDDGPSKEVTPRILDILSQHGAVATFFMLGSQVEYYPDIAKQVADAGHEIGNHTQNHKDLTTLDPDAIHREIIDSGAKIQHATGIRPHLFRPPYGAYDDDTMNDAINNENSLILWSIDSLDWQSRNAARVNREIQSKIRSGAIVLMHDIHPSTADALPELLSTLEEQGYQFVTVSELLELQGENGVGPHYGFVG